MIEKYYEEELQNLYTAGREFAGAHPDIARFLNIDAVGDRDPYVERLFEGFAFLTGRIREKLDDSFPELTGGLISLMWPNFLREIPSLTIVEMKPRRGALHETRVIGRGTEVMSGPVGAEHALCRFMTTQPVTLSPISLSGLERSVDTRGRESVSLRFELDAGADLHKLDLDPLRLCLHAEMPTALALHQFLATRVVAARVAVDGGEGYDIPAADAVTAGGCAADESILPDDNRAFRGYMLLLEYFAYPEKFLFVDLHGLDKLHSCDAGATGFTYTITFDAAMPLNRPFAIENFRLFCTPAVNLFKQDTEPVSCSGKNVEYRITADNRFPLSVRPHSVISIAGIDRATGERGAYAPYFSFETPRGNADRTYSVRYRQASLGKRELFVALGGNQLAGDTLREESLSIEAWCTNGTLPREEIRENGITSGGAGLPDFVRVGNISRPTAPLMPPDENDYLWVFLSHLGATFTSLASAETLRAVLKLYDWSRSESSGRRTDAIVDTSLAPALSTLAGSVIRGVEFTVTITDAAFADAGDLHLFGEVLNEFLSNYVTINSFLRLVFVLRPSGSRLTWSTLEGKRWPV